MFGVERSTLVPSPVILSDERDGLVSPPHISGRLRSFPPFTMSLTPLLPGVMFLHCLLFTPRVKVTSTALLPYPQRNSTPTSS